MCQGETQNRCGSPVGCTSTAEQCGSAPRESTVIIHRPVRLDIGITADVIGLTRDAAAMIAQGVSEEVAYVNLRAFMKALDKRLNVAEEQAQMHHQLMRAAEHLPEGYIVHLSVEKGAGWVVLDDAEGNESEPGEHHGDSSLARQVEMTIDAAIAHAAAATNTPA